MQNTPSSHAIRSNQRYSPYALMAVLAALLALAAGCSKSDESDKAEQAKPQQSAAQQTTPPQSSTAFDTARLPRIAGAKEIYASPATTYFSAPSSVAQTADLVEKALAAQGWQRFGAPLATEFQSDNQQIMSLKKGPRGLGILITAAQGNLTNVQYTEAVLKNDLPFLKDATDIEFDPNRPLLTLTTAGSVDDTLDFYRKALAPLGWALWSAKLNGPAPSGSASGEPRKNGARAYYSQADQQVAELTAQRADDGHTKLKFALVPEDDLRAMQRAFFTGDTIGTPLLDVNLVPRPDGAAVKRSEADRMTYSVAGSVADTVLATKNLLIANGWQPYAAPLERPEGTSLQFKKGAQGLIVLFTMNNGRTDQSDVDYIPDRLQFALALPADASDIVFNTNRPYLNCATAGTVDTTLEFYRKELGAAGWSPLSTENAAKQWPNAQLDDKIPDGLRAYFARGTKHPVMLTLQHRTDGKTTVEIKVPPFAEPQTLEAGDSDFGLPVPKPHPSAGGIGGDRERSIHALVPAEVATVLDFYRRELTALHWTEESQGAVLTADKAVVNFTSPDGPATLKLDHQYDLTNVSLVLHVNKPAPQAQASDPIQAVANALKEAQDMMRAAGITPTPTPAPDRAKNAADTPEPALHALADSTLPVPVPDTAEDVDFDGPGGNLEFNSTSSVKSLADFYRGIMKQQGWTLHPSVINNANMIELEFAKAGKSLNITLLRMGDKTNVGMEGAARRVEDAALAPAAKAAPHAVPRAAVQASADDLEAEDSNGMPVPKRHTMTTGTRTPFRSELQASVPLELADVLGFYRRELGSRAWKEDATGTAGGDSASLRFTTPDGPATLKLSRKDDATEVDLVVRNPDATAKAGMMPKQGQAKILFGNVNPAAETITFNNRPIKVAAGAGTKGPDGPTLDLPPGKYRYSIKLPGQPLLDEVVDIGADETWGLMIGPGGVLPLQAY